MKAPRNASKAGKASPQKSEARTAPTVSGPKVTSSSNQRQHSKATAKGKGLDSRPRVIAKAQAGFTIGIPFHATSPSKLAALRQLRDAHPGCSIKVQEQRLEKALRRWPLTFREMWELGLQDGRARIYGLKQRGLDITKVWVVIETDYGQRHRVALYTLRRGGSVPAMIPSQSRPSRGPTCISATAAESVEQEALA